MPWLDLEEGILEEFAERSAGIVLDARLRRYEDRQRAKQAVYSLRSYEKHRERYWQTRRSRRVETREERDPCLWCGAQVPLTKYGPIPIYCNLKCGMRASNRRTRARRDAEARVSRAVALSAPRLCECGAPAASASRGPVPKWCSVTCKNNASRRSWRARQSSE